MNALHNLTASKPMHHRIATHLSNAAEIVAAPVRSNAAASPSPQRLDALLVRSCLTDYQRAIMQEFSAIITQPSFDFIRKASDSWLPVGDRRRAIASKIKRVIEQHGIGIGWIVLHLQQLCTGHIPMSLVLDGVEVHLARPTLSLHGVHGEHVLQIPIRRFRSDAARLAALGIAKPPPLWDRSRIISHERDGAACFFCSSAEINPAEVVVELRGARLGLSRDISLGATFSPFGNPATVAHVLVWDLAPQPLSMSLSPGGIGDLLRLTAAMNDTIRAFFTARGITDFPTLDGVYNGWAGNSVFHQHCQLFAPEYESPLAAAERIVPTPLAQREDIMISRFDWPMPVYEIRSATPLRTAFVAHELAALWRFLGGGRKVAYRSFPPGLALEDSDLVPAPTQNLYVPGVQCGRTLWFALRDRERVDFSPAAGECINAASNRRALPKKNLGVLE